ncbi:MAG: YopX family protein [Oscillospiraceae bacterium]
MREILFRGKRTDNGEWVYGTPIFYPDGNVVMCRAFKRNHNVIPETVCQFTGLTDKNGRKIFEGDILQCNNNPIDLVKAVYGNFGVIDVETETAVDNVIGWHYEVIPTDELSKVEPFCLPMPLTEYYINRCTMVVIGNIYDNPELLEVSK